MWRRLYKPLLVGIATLTALFICWNPAMANWVDRRDARLERDPATGVVLGTEALDLGDPQAESACLLIHGFAGSRKDLSDLGQRLADAGHRVRLLRLPGHGTTVADLEEQTPAALLEGARAEFKTMQASFQEVSLVGFSMGGAIATLLAAQEQVARLVLVAPYYAITFHWYYLLPVETWNRALNPTVRWVPKTKRSVQLNRRENVDELFANPALPTASVSTLAALGRQASQPEVLQAITAPTLVLHSPTDGAASYAASQAAFAQIGSPDKRFETMDARNNHHILWDWDADEAKAHILTHLAL